MQKTKMRGKTAEWNKVPVQLVIADGADMREDAVKAMIEHIADGAKVQKMEYCGNELVATIQNEVPTHAGA